MPPRITSLLFVFGLSVPACTHDVVLPSADDTDTCGNGFVDPNEDCDNTSPGCTDCKVTPGWKCVQNACYYPCGDGIVGTNTSGDRCDDEQKQAACDMNGWWIARENDAVRDNTTQSPQPASTWYLYRLSQSGTSFQVEQAIHCGFHVTGSATVDCTPATLRGLLYKNDPSVNGPHGARKGTFAVSGNGCSFSFDRWYRVRGGTDALLPADFSQHLSLADLPPLPYEDDPIHPTGAHLDNQEDTDGDGFPGAAFQISGIVTGVREATQRDFKEYATAPGQTVPANAIQFTAYGDWDLEESVLSVQQCGKSCQLIETPGHVDNETLVPRITMRYLGSSLTSERVAAVVVQNPGESIDADLETCANVRLALPHDPTY